MKSFKKLTSFILIIMMLVSVATIASGSIFAAADDAETDASYYLVGNFDGVDVGNEYSANQGYAMVDGQVTVSIKNLAYVCVKNNDSLWYMTDGWLGNNLTSATLYRTDDTSIAKFDKLSVPKGTYTFTVTENSDGTVTLSYAPATNVPPVLAEGYSLIGQFDGVMVGDGDDYASPGYVMDGGKVTVTVESVAYVCVKDNFQLWYMTDGWLGFDATTATLYSVANTSIPEFDRLYVPAGTYTFTLLENSDGTLTLSYAEAGSEPTEPSTGGQDMPTEPTEPSTSDQYMPTDPTEPSTGDQYMPTDPTEPSTGGEDKPTDPTEPSTGGEDKPTDPTEPSTGGQDKPTDPTEPSTGGEDKPSDPTDPVVAGLLGDANGDGVVNVKDATAIQKHIAGLITLTDEGYDVADVDASDVVNVKDATAIQKYIADIETGFPIGKPKTK